MAMRPPRFYPNDATHQPQATQEQIVTDQTPTSTEHVFDLSNMDPDAAVKVAEAIERIRPLSRDQKDNLLDILREDSAVLEAQIVEAFTAARAAKVKEVQGQFPEPESQNDRFRIEAEQLLKAQARAFRKLAKRAKKEGVLMDGPHDYHGERDFWLKRLNVRTDYDRSDYEKAKADALEPIERAQAVALDTIRVAQQDANRKIRLASVSKDASEILGALPNADDIVARIGEAVEAATAEIAAGQPRRKSLLRRH